MVTDFDDCLLCITAESTKNPPSSSLRMQLLANICGCTAGNIITPSLTLLKPELEEMLIFLSLVLHNSIVYCEFVHGKSRGGKHRFRTEACEEHSASDSGVQRVKTSLQRITNSYVGFSLYPSWDSESAMQTCGFKNDN